MTSRNAHFSNGELEQVNGDRTTGVSTTHSPVLQDPRYKICFLVPLLGGSMNQKGKYKRLVQRMRNISYGDGRIPDLLGPAAIQ